MKHRYVLVGVCYSDNLGDGVIADCMDYAIRLKENDAEVVRIDVSGRTNYNTSILENKNRILNFIDALPKPARPFVIIPGILLHLYRGPFKRWAKLLRPNDRVIIGGGQLISHVNHNFPIKLHFISRLTSQKNINYALFAVGVAANWDWLSRRIFRRIFLNPRSKFLCTRDETSQVRLSEGLGVPKDTVALTPDPAVISRWVYQDVQPTSGGIGINIAHPIALKHHTTTNTDEFFEHNRQTKLWTDLIEALVAERQHVCLFTNGAREDQQFLNHVVSKLGKLRQSPYLQILPPAQHPRDLVSQIRGLKVLVGHRLHAHIVGYSFQVPAVPLAWDDKLTGFFETIGEAETVVPLEQVTVETLIVRIAAALTSTRPTSTFEHLSGQFFASLDKLLMSYDS